MPEEVLARWKNSSAGDLLAGVSRGALFRHGETFLRLSTERNQYRFSSPRRRDFGAHCANPRGDA